MGYLLGDATFHDWQSLALAGGWLDVFIFQIAAQACLPPWNYRRLIRGLPNRLARLRPGAALWVQVTAPGQWYRAELRRTLLHSAVPIAITAAGVTPGWLEFSSKPIVYSSPCRPPLPQVPRPVPISTEALLVLQALARMKCSLESEIAAQTGRSLRVVQQALTELSDCQLAVFRPCALAKPSALRSRPQQLNFFPWWQPTQAGLRLALHSWGVPPGARIKSRLERNLHQIGSVHRSQARIWPAWLRQAWPQAEIWSGWCEVGLPDDVVVPDGLAWGRIQGYETLFWLEYGEEHKSSARIASDLRRRLLSARALQARTGVRMVFALLGPPWVLDVARWQCREIPVDMAVLLSAWKRFGKLPTVEWGAVTMA